MFLYLIVVVFLLSRVYQHSRELYSKFNAENGDGEHEKSRLRDRIKPGSTDRESRQVIRRSGSDGWSTQNFIKELP